MLKRAIFLVCAALLLAAMNSASAQDRADPQSTNRRADIESLMLKELPATVFESVTGEIQVAPDGVFSRGSIFISAPIRHSVTGQLQGAISAIDYSRHPHLNAGAILYRSVVVLQRYRGGGPYGPAQAHSAWCGDSARDGMIGACILQSPAGSWIVADIIRGTSDYPAEMHADDNVRLDGSVSIIVDDSPRDRSTEFVLLYERWRHGQGLFRFGVLSPQGFAGGGRLTTRSAEGSRRILETMGGVFEVARVRNGVTVRTITPISGAGSRPTRRVEVR